MMSLSFRRMILLACVISLVASETACLGCEFVASVLRMRGEHVFYQNDLVRAWRLYDKARWWGESEDLDLDVVELLLFGLDQSEGGIRVRQPLPVEHALGSAKSLIEKKLSEEPRNAYYWS